MLSLKSIVSVIKAAIGNQASYMPVYEDTNMLSFVVAGNQKDLLPAISTVRAKCEAWGLHCEDARVRGGRVCMISHRALSEHETAIIGSLLGEQINLGTFENRLDRALQEDQFKSATSGITRANQSSRQRQYYDPKRATYAGKRTLPTRRTAVSESIHGIATATGEQPKALFQKFGVALRSLGNNLGIGAIQDILKSKGIQYKKSNDGLSLIFTVKNAQTGTDIPIHRITCETLESPNDFQESLLALLDIARGDAPGSFQAKQAQMQDIQKSAREISTAVASPNPLQQ
jgi:hypothetical protein